MHGHWIWYELLSHEPARAKAFYEAVAGWHITPGQTPPLHYGMIAGADGTALGGLLPITAEMAASGARPGWVGYLAVEDVDQAIIEVCARGGAVLMPAMDIPQGSTTLTMHPFDKVLKHAATGKEGELLAYINVATGKTPS